MHIHHFASVRDNGIVNNTRSCGVVSLDGAFGLGPSHIDEGLAVGNHLMGRYKESSQLGFVC